MAHHHIIEGQTFTSLKDAARHFDVSVSTCRRWIASGILRGVRIGGTIRVDLSSLKCELLGDVA